MDANALIARDKNIGREPVNQQVTTTILPLIEYPVGMKYKEMQIFLLMLRV